METGVTWLENGAVGRGLEHGQSFQGHLGGAIFTNRSPLVTPNKVNVGLSDGPHPDLFKCSGQKSNEVANQSNGPTMGGASQSHAHHVLLSDKNTP